MEKARIQGFSEHQSTTSCAVVATSFRSALVRTRVYTRRASANRPPGTIRSGRRRILRFRNNYENGNQGQQTVTATCDIPGILELSSKFYPRIRRRRDPNITSKCGIETVPLEPAFNGRVQRPVRGKQRPFLPEQAQRKRTVAGRLKGCRRERRVSSSLRLAEVISLDNRQQ